jgi:hypothetical protein
MSNNESQKKNNKNRRASALNYHCHLQNSVWHKMNDIVIERQI